MTKEEQIRNLLFNGNADVPLQTIRSLIECGYLPERFGIKEVSRWKNTFIGVFLLKRYRKFHILKDMESALGKKPEVEDFTEENLKAVVNYLSEYSPNTAHQYCAQIKGAVNDLLKCDYFYGSIPCKRWADILSHFKKCPTTKPYINVDDIKKLLAYQPESREERIVHARFVVSLMTGARLSDVRKFTVSNVIDGVLTYVPQKTKSSSGKVVSIPVSEITVRFIEVLGESDADYRNQNRTLREICRKCGLDEEVTYFYAGKYVTKPKWQAMRSHIGRVSFVTNLIKMGQPVHEVSKLAGHTDITMTLRYNASTEVNLTKEANDFINMKF